MAGPETIARKGDTPATSFVYTVELAQLMEHFAEAGDWSRTSSSASSRPGT
jgi:hypothetical protein